MITLDEHTKAELIREIATALAKKQRLAFASDFHAFAEGRTLILAGIPFENFPKGPNTKRSDGDVVAHAIVMALIRINLRTVELGIGHELIGVGPLATRIDGTARLHHLSRSLDDARDRNDTCQGQRQARR